jgi:hypothetical protein
MRLEEHLRRLYMLSSVDLDEAEISMSVRVVKKGIEEAQNGETNWLLGDTRNVVLLFHELEQAGVLDIPSAYVALRTYVRFLIDECPNMALELNNILECVLGFKTTLH